MKQFLFAGLLACVLARGNAATVTVGPWTPVFQGIELASGQQVPTLAGERYHQVLCYRVDLQDPDVRLFTTPHCTNSCAQETLVQNPSHFLETFGVQAAVNGAFYASSTGPTDEALGTPEMVRGLAISRGNIVSAADENAYSAALLFTTNNQAFYIPSNTSPGTNTAGLFTAISGNVALLINGVNTQTPNPSDDLDPRTALGLSANRRYLFMLTVDGRQGTAQGVNPPWSDGADFYNTGEWLLRFGAADGINIDGGGSTTMVMADCGGKASRLNRSSFVAAYGRERNVGHNFGVFARSLATDIKDLAVIPGSTTATLTWRTEIPTTAQVEYGLTASYGSVTPLDGRLLKYHAATLNGLGAGSNYFFRINSGGYTQACALATVTAVSSTLVHGLNKTWRFTTNSLDAEPWKTPAYPEITPAWLGSGAGLLYVLENNAAVSPRTTVMPPNGGGITSIPRTYYFRSGFNFFGSTNGLSFTFSNYVDDGAVFYLNGVEIQRVRMAAAPAAINYSSVPTASPCTGDATTICPDVFTISGALLLTNLVQGTNVLAVEVHNISPGTDLVFGSALIMNQPQSVQPRLTAWQEGAHGTIFWNAAGFTLQRSTNVSSTNNWVNAPGPVTQSPVLLTNSPSYFYRLKN